MGGVWWYRRDDWTLGAQVIAKATDLPGRMLRGSGVLQPMFGVVAPSDRGVVFGDVEGIAWGEDGSAMPLDSLGVLAWLSAASHLMGVPTVAQHRRVDARTGKEAGPRSRPQDVVRLVDLRPMRYERVESDASGRRYRHRWVVRGHWAQQAHGPGRSLRKTIYREPYIKGPEGAPLLATETGCTCGAAETPNSAPTVMVGALWRPGAYCRSGSSRLSHSRSCHSRRA